MTGAFTYTARVTAINGAVVPCLAFGRTAGCALTNLRRSLRGAWTRIEVGVGEGEGFVMLQAVSK